MEGSAKCAFKWTHLPANTKTNLQTHVLSRSHTTCPSGQHNQAPSIRTNSHRQTRQAILLWKPNLYPKIVLLCLVWRFSHAITANKERQTASKGLNQARKQEEWDRKSCPVWKTACLDNLVASTWANLGNEVVRILILTNRPNNGFSH